MGFSLMKKGIKKLDRRTEESICIALFDPNSGDTSETAMYLAQEWRKNTGKKAVIVEFPCLGLPRMSGRIGNSEGLLKDQSIEQFLLDLERKDLKSFDDYMFHGEDADFIIVNPKTNLDIPVLVKLIDASTPIAAPIHLKKGLSAHYDLILFSLQGQIFHPMTFVSLRQADGIILSIPDLFTVPISYMSYKKLLNYGITESQVALYTPKKIEIPEKIYRKEQLLQFIFSIEKRKDHKSDLTTNKNFSSHIGIINPVEHVSYQNTDQFNQAELTQKDAEVFKSLVDHTRRYLRQHYSDEFVAAIFDERERSKIKYYISDFIREQTQYKFQIDIDIVIEMVQREITEMGVLQPALDDPKVSSIEINGPDEVICETSGVPTHDESIRFQDNEHIYSVISKMLTPMGRTLSANDPVIDSNYRGFRLNVTLDRNRGGISSNHPIISIRKFPPDIYSDDDCIAYGNMSEEIVEFFQDVYPLGVNVIIGGSVNTGKTSHLIRIPLYLPELTRILTIEDSEEMMLKQKEAYQSYPNIAAFIVKEHENPRRRYNIAKIVKVTLRQNPDWILIGEVRDGEAASEALEAANTGNSIALSIHANDAEMTAVRFMQLSGNNEIAASQVGSTMDMIIFLENVSSRRIVTEISELLSFEGNHPVLNTIFKYDFNSKTHKRVGSLIKLAEKMKKKGAPVRIYERWCNVIEVYE
ncbi:ATPase, T2SS/T4P/T4SS family [Paenibacillus macquariensis]|uniref:Pilus assembly protein CpaF n=1 Tax=Paenibacillus macquariensis TaxID=948756 RepID=A0ABY1KEK4_9BACL|nr:ATPase, T2SS/T4P/T4SS family [Paenibacillus macquariensis]OAB30518.1 hypothetical protein PMSM_22765 [Paenibacillus macquariensis subsp. macquariensis]SIR71212.1 pilus assembly protein CpaF [Paenibacillus macquariensis]